MVAESLFPPETAMINRDEISPLITLQEAQSTFSDISEKLADIPAKLEQLEQQLAEVRDRNNQVHKNAETARKKCRDAENNLADLQQALERYNKQIYDVKSNKEYSAMIAEIADIKIKINDTETEILMAMDELEALTAEVSIADDLLGKEEKEITAKQRILNAEQKQLEMNLDKVKTELDNARSAVPPTLMSEYDRIHKYTGSTVVAPAIKRGDYYACGGCYVKITPHIMTELRKGNVFQCEACARLIYWCNDEP
jgi:predicted  nucleic acid-binding Zn-ribbon protein